MKQLQTLVMVAKDCICGYSLLMHGRSAREAESYIYCQNENCIFFGKKFKVPLHTFEELE